MRKPPWLKVRIPAPAAVAPVEGLLRELRLHTVCHSARCPNRGRCFSRGTATFMILGENCTRSCGYCAVAHGKPAPLDPGEPARVAAAAARLGLTHVVITSVARDDLRDGGAAHFAAVVAAVRDRTPAAAIEVLVPDFGGDEAALATLLAAGPDIVNHNIETVPRLHPVIRPQGDYERSLDLLRRVKTWSPAPVTKSGLMLGLGEREDEVLDVLRDLRAAGCDIVTIGQYLQPTPRHLPVETYVPPARFAAYRRAAERLGFAAVFAGPLVRSSYHAGDILRFVRRVQPGR